jgi:hypothetical protein
LRRSFAEEHEPTSATARAKESKNATGRMDGGL